MMKNNYMRILTLFLLVLSAQYISAQCTSSTTYLQQTTCEGQPVIFNGVSLDTAGTYNDTIVLAGGCDSVISLQLFVIPILRTEFFDTICAGGSVTFNSQTLTASGTYGDTLYYGANFCDSVVLLHLYVRPGAGTVNVTRTASACVTRGGPGGGNTGGYNFYGTILTRSGTYRDTVTSSTAVCTDTIITLNLTVYNAPRPTTINQSQCSGTYTFNGVVLSTSGTYVDTLTSVYGCDSIVTLNLSIGAVAGPTVNGTACPGSYFTFRGNNYAPGAGGGAGGGGATYYDTIVTGTGCDSIYTIRVTTTPGAPRPVTIAASICSGQSYTFYGRTLTAAGTYYDTVPSNTGGCDTIVTLNLSIGSYFSGPTINGVACTGSAGYVWRGVTYPGPAGFGGGRPVVYYDTVPAVSGCDTIFTISVSSAGFVRPTFVTASICAGGSYTFGNQTLTTAGTYTDTLTSVVTGCDSVITLRLTIGSYYQPTATTATFCQGTSYVWRGVTYTQPSPGGGFGGGGYKDTVPSTTGGCDTIFTLNLTSTPAPRYTVTDSFCQGTTYYFHGDSFTTSGTDTIYSPSPVAGSCDTVIILRLSYKYNGTVPTIIPPVSGSNTLSTGTTASGYQWYLNGQAVAGDTTQSILVSQSGVYTVRTTTAGSTCPGLLSAGVSVVLAGISDVSSDMFKIYPNPSTGKFTIETAQYAGAEISISDVLGRTVYQKQLSASKETIDMTNATSGTYYLMMKTAQGTSYTHFVIAQ